LCVEEGLPRRSFSEGGRAEVKGDIFVPHVHLPQLEDDEEPAADPNDAPAANPSPLADKRVQRSKWFLKIGLEALLISMGVFLALMGEQWREHTHTRELAEASLRRFRTEIVTNRQAVATVEEYHVELLKNLKAYLASDPKTRQSNPIQIKGLQPAFFEDAEWDLAISTQSLAQIDPPTAGALSRIYSVQRRYADLTRGIMQAVYLRPMTENFEALTYYYGDLVLWEPALLKMYDEILPQIDRRLGESSRDASAPH
jgi:hypothetical protein